jgi:hypothetical protein
MHPSFERETVDENRVQCKQSGGLPAGDFP